MPIAVKYLVMFALSISLAGCDIPRPSAVVCDCQIEPGTYPEGWATLDQAPANFDRETMRKLVFVDESGFPIKAFDTSSIHWYRNGDGESLGCVVYDGSNHVNAVFRLAADASQTSVIDIRFMGIPFGRHPFFWERCDD